MTTEEHEIVAFLKQCPDVYFGRKEISRKARRREEYEENPNWATGPLASLVAQGHVVENLSGQYAINPEYDGI